MFMFRSFAMYLKLGFLMQFDWEILVT